MAVEIKIDEICNRFARPVRRHVAHAEEPPRTMGYFNICQVGGMKLVRPARWRANALVCIRTVR